MIVQALQFRFDLGQSHRQPAPVLSELLPAAAQKWNGANALGCFDSRTAVLHDSLFAELLVGRRDRVRLVHQLLLLLVQRRNISKQLLGFFTALLVGRTALFDFGIAEIDQIIEILGSRA